MKRIRLSVILFFMVVVCNTITSQIPKFNHVIFVLEENYSYSEIIGVAPTFTALSTEPYCVNFTQAFAITHPSEPNYLALFSGSQQGVSTDIVGPAPGAPFGDCNLGASLDSLGYTFIGYSEDQPSVGWISADAGLYATKHCPWINWVGAGHQDSIRITSDVPFAGYFPDSTHYSTLPTVSWVIPNLVDDMHNGSIPSGDTWFKTNMMPLVRWAINPANKTLVIATWDEDDGGSPNQIPLLFCSGWVNGGNCSATVNHFSVLRTIEDMYSLLPCGSSAAASDVPPSIWKVGAGVNTTDKPLIDISLGPVPAKDKLNVMVSVNEETKSNIVILDITGRIVKNIPVELKNGTNSFMLNISDLHNGIYCLQISGEKINITKKFAVGE